MAKTVYLGMIGDIMHPGLINIINEGAKYGDVMIGLFTDKAIATHKRLPYLNYEQNISAYIKTAAVLIAPYSYRSSLNSGTIPLAFSYGKTPQCILLRLRKRNQKSRYCKRVAIALVLRCSMPVSYCPLIEEDKKLYLTGENFLVY